MTPKERQRLLKNLAMRRKARRVVDDCHDGQKRFLFAADPTKPSVLASYVALLSPRRFGKTEGFLRYAASVCLRTPRRRVAVIYKHRVDGVDVAWPLLEDLDAKYGWEAKFNKNELSLTFKNGSIIKIFGSDYRFRGQRNDLVLIDEAQEFLSTKELQIILRKLIPGLAERHGRLFLIGTPGEQQSGLFWEVVDGQHPEYAVETGTSFENPYTRDYLKEQLDGLRRANPNIDDEPWVQREFYGRWVVDTRENVVSIDPILNYLYKWERHDDDQYVISCDWGDENAAFSVGVYNTTQYPWMVVLMTRVVHKGLVSEHAEVIRGLQSIFPGAVVVADPGGLAKTMKRELEVVYGIPLVNAEKEDRIGQVELLKTDVSLGLLKIYNYDDPEHPEDSLIAQQWRKLVWKVNDRTGKKEESKPRDVHDTVLYMRRYIAKHLFAQVDDTKIPEVGSEDYWKLEEARMEAADREEARQRAEASLWQ